MANGIVLGGKLKFRKTASTSGTVITSIPTGTVLSVTAVSGIAGIKRLTAPMVLVMS